MISELEYIYSPYLSLYLPLWKQDGPTITSDDAYGRLCTRTGVAHNPILGDYFDGIDNKIVVSMPDATPPYTASIWVKPASLAGIYAYFASGYTDLTSLGFAIGINNSSDTIVFGNNSHQMGLSGISTYLTVGKWTNIIKIDDASSNAAVLIDGIQQTLVSTSYLSNNAGYTTIGARYANGYGRFAPVTIGEALYYNINRAVTEAQNIYLATKWRYQ
jgi:hypothetical protein